MGQGCSYLQKGPNKGIPERVFGALKSHWLPAAPVGYGGLGGNGAQDGAGVLRLWFCGCHPSLCAPIIFKQTFLSTGHPLLPSCLPSFFKYSFI